MLPVYDYIIKVISFNNSDDRKSYRNLIGFAIISDALRIKYFKLDI